jgi:hypothetical protein
MYCKSDQADRIRAGFKQYLQKHEHIALKE